MNDKWIVSAPWTKEQGPINISLGSQIRDDFEIIKHATEFGITIDFHWTGLSHQEVANLRNLVNSDGLKTLLRSYGYAPGWGANVILTEVDPNNAEFGLMIDSAEDIPQIYIDEIVSFIKTYRVQ